MQSETEPKKRPHVLSGAFVLAHPLAYPPLRNRIYIYIYIYIYGAPPGVPPCAEVVRGNSENIILAAGRIVLGHVDLTRTVMSVLEEHEPLESRSLHCLPGGLASA